MSAIGLGCMGMSEFYGPGDDQQSLETLAHAFDIGVTLWDTADVYGLGHNEALVGRALRGRRDKIVLASKFGIERDEHGAILGINGSPGYVRKACDASLRRLGVETIDLYYQHRVDTKTPIEETVGAMSRLVEAGKVRYLGLSEASAGNLEKASAVHPIAALQSEYSLSSRDIESDILPACRDLGIGLVAYSPLGRGLLSGSIRSFDELADDDWRRHGPRFQGENLDRNLELVECLETIADEKSCTTAQLAIAWVLARGGDIVPIPGTRRRARLDENVAAAGVELTPRNLADLEAAMPAGSVAGNRYPEPMMNLINAQ